MTRKLIWIITGLFLALAIHVVTILIQPRLLTGDIWDLVEGLTKPDSITVLDAISSGTEILPMLDPAMEHAVCRFDISNSPQIISGDLGDFFWTIAIFNKHAELLYSLNFNDSRGDQLDLVIVNSSQTDDFIEDSLVELSKLTIVEIPEGELFVLIRVFPSDYTLRVSVRAALSNLECRVWR